ncbi:MAG: MarR family transcriptional regulator [Microthrixaceae bacterium]
MSTSSPRWLSDEEQETWLSLVSMLIRLPAQLDRQLQRDAGITHFEYQVLAGLSEASEATMRMTSLAERTEGSLPRLSQVVARLEKRGWVTRSTDPDDGRCTLATLTSEGLDKVIEAAPGHVAEVRRLVLDPLSPTQAKQLRTIGERVIQAVDASAGEVNT